jgi:hypothetical protein
VEDTQLQLLEDSGVFEGLDGKQHSVRLFSLQVASPISRFHSATTYCVVYFTDDGPIYRRDRQALRSYAPAKRVYESYVRDAKLGKLQ